MSSFPVSTHCQSWLFSPDTLLQKKTECNEKAFAHLRKPQNEGEQGGASSAKMSEKKKKIRAEAGTGLTVQDEDLLKRHYELKIQEICEKLQFPEKVMATAIIFFKRFYLQKSITGFNPKDIMLACIYLAGKVEESFIPVAALAEPLKVEPKGILDKEITLLEGLHFQLIVYHPYRALHGFIMDIKDKTPPPNIDKMWALAKKFVHRVLTTDACLLYPPAQIALAALLDAGSHFSHSFATYIHTRFSSKPGFHQMVANIAKIRELIAIGNKDPELAEVRRIDRKLRFCVNTEAIKKKKEREDKEKEVHRERKRKKLEAEAQAEEAFLTGLQPGQGSEGQEDGENFLKRVTKKPKIEKEEKEKEK